MSRRVSDGIHVADEIADTVVAHEVPASQWHCFVEVENRQDEFATPHASRARVFRVGWRHRPVVGRRRPLILVDVRTHVETPIPLRRMGVAALLASGEGVVSGVLLW